MDSLKNYGSFSSLGAFSPKKKYTQSVATPQSLQNMSFTGKPVQVPTTGVSTVQNSSNGATAPVNPAVKTPQAQKYLASISATPTPQTQTPLVGNVQTPSGATVNTQTGGLIQAPKVDPQQGYRDAFQQYISALQPSSEESQARKYLSNLTLQQKKDQEEALNRGESLGFATGEAQRVNRNNAFAIEGASNALDAFTAQRQVMTEAQKARLDFEKSLLSDTESQIEKVGNDIIRIGADGKAEKIYTGSPDVKTQIVQAGGQTLLVNSDTGQTIRSLGASEGSLSRAASAARAGAGGGALKESVFEKNALGFFLRGEDALKTAETLESKIQGKSLAGQARLEWAPNILQSDENQVYRQLQRQFTEARLRKESGAAIPPAEYQNDARTYFAQPGDSKTVLERKRAAREIVLNSLKISAGNAFKNYTGNAPSGGTSQIIIAPDGTEIELID